MQHLTIALCLFKLLAVVSGSAVPAANVTSIPTDNGHGSDGSANEAVMASEVLRGTVGKAGTAVQVFTTPIGAKVTIDYRIDNAAQANKFSISTTEPVRAVYLWTPYVPAKPSDAERVLATRFKAESISSAQQPRLVRLELDAAAQGSVFVARHLPLGSVIMLLSQQEMLPPAIARKLPSPGQRNYVPSVTENNVVHTLKEELTAHGIIGLIVRGQRLTTDASTLLPKPLAKPLHNPLHATEGRARFVKLSPSSPTKPSSARQ